jgi:hypothetical protein
MFRCYDRRWAVVFVEAKIIITSTATPHAALLPLGGRFC